MNRYAEERAEALRLALGIGGFPQEQDTDRMLEWFGACVLVRETAGARAHCRHREDGTAILTVPAHLRRWERCEVVMEEVAHFLLQVGLGAMLYTEAADRRTEWIARAWERKEEYAAQVFVAAWFLPSRLVRALDDEELHLRSGCSLEAVRKRRQALRGHVYSLRAPPPWAAWHRFHVDPWVGRHRYLSVQSEHGAPVAFVIPVTPETQTEVALRLSADLIALTEREFVAKYEEWRLQRIDSTRYGVPEVMRWSAALQSRN